MATLVVGFLYSQSLHLPRSRSRRQPHQSASAAVAPVSQSSPSRTQVGVPVLLNWFGHFFMLGYYTFLSTFVDPVIRPSLSSLPSEMRYRWSRYLDAWKYGAGLDYEL